jgi:osmoprotectant transport system substrate-binding protein
VCWWRDAGCAPPRPGSSGDWGEEFYGAGGAGELLAQEIEAKSNLKVERRFYLAGSYICQQALVAGRIDGYVEYTGTALTAILKQPVDRDPDAGAGDGAAACMQSKYHIVVRRRWGLRIRLPW